MGKDMIARGMAGKANADLAEIATGWLNDTRPSINIANPPGGYTACVGDGTTAGASGFS